MLGLAVVCLIPGVPATIGTMATIGRRTAEAWEGSLLVQPEAVGDRGRLAAAGHPSLARIRETWTPAVLRVPPAAAVALRRHVADSPDRETAKPLTTLRGVEPVRGPLVRGHLLQAPP
jgi:hypothetical protein